MTSAVIQSLYRETSPADAVARRVVAQCAVAKVAVVATHLAPGVVAYLLLHYAREPISRTLDIDQGTAQVGVIMTSIMMGMGRPLLLLPGSLTGFPIAT